MRLAGGIPGGDRSISGAVRTADRPGRLQAVVQQGYPVFAVAAGLLVPEAAQAQSVAQSVLSSPPFWIALAVLAGFAGAALLGWTALRQRRTLLLGRIMESLPVARMVVDSAGRTFSATDSWRALLGDPDSSLARIEAIAERGGMADRFERLRAAIAGGYPAREDIRLDLPGMDHARVSVHPLPQHAGHVIWSIEDASDRYELERVIRSEQQKLIDFVENAPIGFFSVDRDGRFLYANATFAEWLGRPEAELSGGGAQLADFLPGPVRNRCPAYSPLPGENGDAFGETTFAGANDQLFDAYVTQTVVEDGGGLHTRSLVRHLSAERDLEEAMQVSQRRFHRFFEDAPVGIVLLDDDGCITECNNAFGQSVAVDRTLAVHKKFWDFVQSEDQDACRDWLAKAYEAGVPPAPIEVSIGEVAVSLYAARADSAGGAGLIVHVFDLSEQKRLEAQFFQSQKMELVGQLAGGVAHDFNNLLTAMIGFCDLLLLRHTPRDQSFADIQQIKQNANRAANLVRQLLAFSRQQTLQPKVLDLTEVLSETSHLLRRLIGANIELKFYHGRDLWLTKADQGQLEQVVINLAVNARDAMESGGILTIRTGNIHSGDPRLSQYEGIPDGDYVLLEMQDTGTGIPPEVVDKIFEPFFTTKEVGAGTGLGLSTVYGIVKQTGGYIFVDSVPGEGARFSVYLPHHREEEDAAPVVEEHDDEEARRDLTGAGTVLLVEDEDAVRLFGARALRNKGYSVIEAKDGEDALLMLNGAVDGMATTVDGQAIDLLITDVVMPGVDGPTLVKEVRERYPELKVIFISGYTEDTFRQKLGAGEQVDFLPKPFTLQQLAGKVKEVLDGGGVAAKAD